MRAPLALAKLALTAAAGLAGCSQPVYRASPAPLQSVARVDLDRYLGRWYEIYRLPNGFEDSDCLAVTAEYARRSDGLIGVTNTCAKKGGVERARGVARVTDTASNARLEVSFFRPFYGSYWIIDLADDYSWALVGEPAGKYLWLLSRVPQLPAALEAELLGRVRALGYPTDRLIRVANAVEVPRS